MSVLTARIPDCPHCATLPITIKPRRGEGTLHSRVNISCGLDVHKSSISGAILTSEGTSVTQKFSTTIDGLLEMKEWIVNYHCERVLMEATGIFWIPVYSVLEPYVDVHVVNPLFIKYVPGRKTDALDSVWIAEIALNGMFKSSYIPSKDIRELRELTRTYRKLIEERTNHKNRIHKILVRNGIRLSDVLSDIFGKYGMMIIKSIIEGKSLDQTLKTIHNSRILKKKEEIKKAICGELSENDLFVIRQTLECVEQHDCQITQYENRILKNMLPETGNIEILVSIPGIGFTIGSSILAEIGNIHQFECPKKLVSWAGLSPAVYESAGKTAHGHITKRGSKYLRTMLIEAAQSVARGKPNRLKHFFSRIQSRKGYKKAIVALARKLLTIIHHLLINNEKYVESPGKEKSIKLPDISPNPVMDHENMIHILTQAGYIVNKSHPHL